MKNHQHTRSQASIPMMPITIYSQYTPADLFDLRCEYEVPRFIDLDHIDEEQDYQHEINQPLTQEEEFF